MWNAKVAAKCEARIAQIMAEQGFVEGTEEYKVSMAKRMASMKVMLSGKVGPDA